MTVYLIEIRHAEYTELHVTASYDRAQHELNTAEVRNVDVIVTTFEVEDFVRP